MKKTIFMEKYPVYTLEIPKEETTYKTISEILTYLKALVDEHKIAKYIATFNHYEHTTSINGDINPEIKDAQNLVFCFGPAIPNTKILAARPRSIGIAELEDKFIIEFLEAPKEQLNDLMETWAKSIANK
jgi:hypothetical protein